jgi:hypothetical protein
LIRLATLLLLITAPALAAQEPGLFHEGAGSCDPALVGEISGPVRINATRLEAARGTCTFTGETRISRMDGASLLDATCRPAGGRESFETRFFLSYTDRGVTVVSPAWGTWALGRCP